MIMIHSLTLKKSWKSFNHFLSNQQPLSYNPMYISNLNMKHIEYLKVPARIFEYDPNQSFIITMKQEIIFDPAIDTIIIYIKDMFCLNNKHLSLKIYVNNQLFHHLNL